MIKNQFIYKEKVIIPGKEGEEATTITLRHGFNLNKVIRVVETQQGFHVVLDDFHEEVREAPILNKKQAITGYKNERNTYFSDIYLSKEDGNRLLDTIGL